LHVWLEHKFIGSPESGKLDKDWHWVLKMCCWSTYEGWRWCIWSKHGAEF